MGMVVRTNTMALNAYRQLGMNNSAVAKSLEKLSSGFRINRAGDDAAGLAISEKMKAQITGLETASANAQDGISLIQTAEGNLTEVHSMLNRMVELASKSANGTYTSQERQALQDEVNSLLDEIDRISKSANFNGTKLLNGTMGLNTDALEIGATSDYVAAGDKAMEVTATHSSASGSEKIPSFVVDFKDFSYEIENDATTVAKAGIALTVGGKAITAWDGTANDFGAIEFTAGDKDTDLAVGATDIVGKLTGAKTVLIDGYVYKAEAGDGTTDVKFTFVGAKDTTVTTGTTPGASATDTKVPEGIFVPKGDFSVTASKTAGTGDTSGDGRFDCNIYNITDPAVGADPVRAGAKITLTADMIKAGNQLKIGDTVFTFTAGDDPATVTANTNGANTNIIVDSKLSAEEQLKSVTRQLSFMTASIKDGNGTARVFNVGRSNDGSLGGIEIEENETTAANLGKFTEAQLKAAFKLGTSETMASSSVTVKDFDKLADGDAINVGGESFSFNKKDTLADTLADMAAQINANDKLKANYTASVEGNKVVIKGKTAADKSVDVASNGLTLQIGDTADTFNKMTVAVKDMSAKGLGLEGLKETGIMTEASSSAAIDTIKNAINTVSTTRAGMGALQNRLDHTINNLDVAVENLSAANSRIRDTDMAKEMMNYTKMNVLVQSAQAMLAQANQQPQSVLQLLQ